MRAGACAVQQTLTSEAASVLKHSLILARRRGHAQITPLHVAATLLTSRLSLFKRACLKSQPFHSRALELCFNVALNRLPTTPTPLLHTQPCLSNALIAALKRAQAHQRRGSIEQQHQHQQQHHPQQPLLGIKVELEQLVVSILDDPSVSRVMREAGLSSIDVKKNLDDCLVSSVFQCYNISSGGGIYSTPNSPPTPSRSSSPQKNKLLPTNFSTDMKLVLDVLLRKKKRNVVVVGDLISVTEAFVAELKCKVETGDVPEELKSLHFIRFEIFSTNLKLMRREEVETNISGLKSKIDSLVLGGKGVIIYIGDLKWAVKSDEFCNNSNSPVDYLVQGIGKLVSCYCNLNVWLMASANYHTYMRCQMMQPNLDNQWSLQAVHVPSNGLGLTLNAAARFESMSKNPVNTEKELSDMFNSTTCCGECALNYEKELSLNNNFDKKLSNELPYWLRPPQNNLKDESVDLKRKWSKLCQTLHKGSRDNQNQMIPSPSNQGYHGNNLHPCWPTYTGIPDAKSISFAGSSFNPNPNSHSVPRFRRQQSCHIEFNFSNANHKTKQDVPNLDSLKGSQEDKEENITLALGNSLISGSRMQNATDMCKMLQEYVPWQSEIIPSVVQVLLDSISGKKDTWLLINGNDNVGKIRLAFAIAETVLGSADSMLEFRTRNRSSSARCWVEMLENALKHQDKVVVFVEDIDLADPEFLKFLADICQFRTSNDTNRKPCQTIFVLTRCVALEPNDSGSRAVSADNKRKGEWDFSSNGKSPRKEGMEYVQNALDLNIKADEEQQNPLGFLELIKNTFVFNRDLTKDNYM